MYGTTQIRVTHIRHTHELTGAAEVVPYARALLRRPVE